MARLINAHPLRDKHELNTRALLWKRMARPDRLCPSDLHVHYAQYINGPSEPKVLTIAARVILSNKYLHIILGDE